MADVVELQCASDVRSVKGSQKNRGVLLKLLRSVYFMVKHYISHTTTYQDLLALQVANATNSLSST